METNEENEKPEKTTDNQCPDTLQAESKAAISDGLTDTKLQHDDDRNDDHAGVIRTENEDSATNGPIGTKLQNVKDGGIDGLQTDVLCGGKDESTRCQDRQNLLVDKASSHDKVPGATRKEVTEGISTSSSASPAQETTTQIISEMCANHKDRGIEYFCHTHSVLGCIICMDLEHCQCRVDFIPESSKQLGNSDEVSKIIEQLSDLTKELVSAKLEVSEKVKIVHDCKHKAIQDIERFRKKMNAFLDKLKENTVHKAQSIEDDGLRKLQPLTEETETLARMVEVMRTDIDTVKATGCDNQLYIKMKKTKQEANNLHMRLEKVKARAHVTNHVFKPGRVFEDLILTTSELGDFVKIEPELADFGSMFVENLMIGLSMPELYNSSTTFTGIEVIPPNKLIITGWSANTTFLVDSTSGKINARIETPSPPWDVTSVGDNMVAITVPENNSIQLVSIKDDTLHAYRELNVNGECFGVVCTGDALVVTIPGQIQVIDMNGVRLRTITKGAFGAHLSDKSLSIALALDKKSVYVSDGKHNTVSRISLSGEVLGFYMSGTLVQPAGLTVDKHGLVFVCGKKSNNVHCLTQNLSEGRVLLNKDDDDIVGPGCIAYCSRTHSLYLGRQYPVEKKIKIFKLLR